MIDYKKKYEETFDKIKDLYNEMRWLSSREARETVLSLEAKFPELKESKEERIRKELLVFFENEMEKYGNEEWDGCFHTTDVIAWLEKQKEPKSVEIKDFSIKKNGRRIPLYRRI